MENEENNPKIKILKTTVLILVLGFVGSVMISTYFFGNKSTIDQINGISKELNKQFDARFKNQETQIEKYRQDLEFQAEIGSYDRIRMGDATNILLALQNYSFEKNDLPSALVDLGNKGYYSGNFNDPESGTEYYYAKIDAENYVLCIYLSTGVWGTNKSQCPSNLTAAGTDDKNQATATETKE